MLLHPDFVKMVVDALPADVKNACENIGSLVAVAGGFVRDVITAAEPKDIDIFATDEMVSERLINWFEFSSEAYSEFKTKNAATFRPKGEGAVVQVVTRVYYPIHEQLIASFDFSICQACVYFNGSGWTGECTPEFWADVTENKMRYTAPQRDEDPGASVLRMLRFTERGYHIDEKDAAKVLARFHSQINKEKEGCAYRRIRKAFRGVHHRGSETL